MKYILLPIFKLVYTILLTLLYLIIDIPLIIIYIVWTLDIKNIEEEILEHNLTWFKSSISLYSKYKPTMFEIYTFKTTYHYLWGYEPTKISGKKL